jgi:hypothetical protein
MLVIHSKRLGGGVLNEVANPFSHR